MTTMTKLENLPGRHHETGSVANALALAGVTAPHTGEPVSEALLLGLADGPAFGYFTFLYEGFPPQLVLLPRNTFDPMETLLDRLGSPREEYKTAKPETAADNLRTALDSGPAIVWADVFSLPYNPHATSSQMWGMAPLVVSELTVGDVVIADRSARPLHVPLADLIHAMGRVKSNRYRTISIEPPNWERLKEGLRAGMRQSVALFFDTPPKGRKENFGAAAFAHWADMLENTRNKQSWARFFEPGTPMASALAGSGWMSGVFDYVRAHAAGDGFERGVAADLCDEAAGLLKLPGLKDAAAAFREAQSAWVALAEAALPDSVPAFKRLKALKLERRAIFTEQGSEGYAQLAALDADISALKAEISADFPLDAAAANELRAELRTHVQAVAALETDAFTAIRAALAG
ncbi:MAG: hypothetical protein IPM16_21355 [Chloroflexi bacterium]|nr:hypothetical protein [Chloroflexota bacterium]